MALALCTDAVKPPERLDFWRKVLLDQFKFDCHIESNVESEFRQSMSVRQIGPLSIMELQAMPFRAVRQSWGQDCLVTVVVPLEGSATLSLNKIEVPLEVGTFCAYHSCKLAHLTYHNPCRHLVATVPSVFMADRCPEWKCDILLTLPAADGVGAMLSELIQSLSVHEECLTDSCRQASLELTLSLLIGAVRAQSESPEYAATRAQGFHKERIRNFALSHLRDPELSISKIATGVGLSLRYIHRLFADEPLRLMQWVYEQRLMRCHRDLFDPEKLNRSISEIAYAWGFNSQAHFSRTFQARFGLTPSDVRGQAKAASAATFSK